MNLQLTPDQRALVDAVEQMLERYREVPREGTFTHVSAELDARLRTSGFLGVACEDGMGGLEAALIVAAVSRSPAAVETGASALVAPGALGQMVEGPVALVADVRRAARFLDVARSAFVLAADGPYLLDLADARREPVHTLFNYPYGRFTEAPDLAGGRKLSAEEAARLMTWWRISIAAEAAGAMQAALDFTVEYVKTRRQFNRALGSYQAIQHRLSERTVQAEATRWLALEAAWKGDAGSAALAAAYAQRAIPSLVHDVHQFNGALGITLDHPLHYWTFRLTALQAELGGAGAQGVAAAQALWLTPAA